MNPPEPRFVASPDVAVLLNALLDRLERQENRLASAPGISPVRSVKVVLNELGLPGYDSQVDPEPRQLANEQFLALESAGWLRLFWQKGEKGIC